MSYPEYFDRNVPRIPRILGRNTVPYRPHDIPRPYLMPFDASDQRTLAPSNIPLSRRQNKLGGNSDNKFFEFTTESMPPLIVIAATVVISLGIIAVGILLSTGVILGGDSDSGSVQTFSLNGVVKLFNEVFTDALGIPSSANFRQYESEFCEEMELILSSQNLTQYLEECTVNEIRNGSVVVVNFTLTFEISSDNKNEFGKTVTELLADSVYLTVPVDRSIEFAEAGEGTDFCSTASPPCEGECQNLLFSFRCYCQTGAVYRLSEDGTCPQQVTDGRPSSSSGGCTSSKGSPAPSTAV